MKKKKYFYQNIVMCKLCEEMMQMKTGKDALHNMNMVHRIPNSIFCSLVNLFAACLWNLISGLW
jgi:hypothetical protein